MGPLRQISLHDVTETVAAAYSVPAATLRGPGRTQAVALARHVAMALAREMTPASLADIGRFFGGRDHTSVIYAVRKIRGRERVDPSLQATLAWLRAHLPWLRAHPPSMTVSSQMKSTPHPAILWDGH